MTTAEYEVAGYRCRTCGRLSHDPSGNCEHSAPEPLYAKAAPSAPAEWCPVCHTYHASPGGKTDAGRLTRQCPQLADDDPRNVFANFP